MRGELLLVGAFGVAEAMNASPRWSMNHQNFGERSVAPYGMGQRRLVHSSVIVSASSSFTTSCTILVTA